jgi:tRNA (guanine37-N1)-methyltransferase
MRFDILTIFPEFFRGPLDFGVLHRALREGKVSVQTHALRDFTDDRHRTVDDRPFGGGEGMVLKADPIFRCAESLGVTPKAERQFHRESVILLSAAGRRFTQATARELAGLERLTLICGRYEGVDERVAELLCDRELCVGDFVLSGGELPALVVVDAVTRLLPGVLGHADSARFESFGDQDDAEELAAPDGSPRATHGSGGLLDYPHYTRPAVYRGVAIPDALAGGDHQAVRAWRRQAALARTLRHRPDLLANATLSAEDQQWLATLEQESKKES